MTDTRYPVLSFHQFGRASGDELILFAAPARKIAAWAGIPRKGWRVRMLYQRWATLSRASEVTTFWDDAGDDSAGSGRVLLGPTALTLAAVDPPDITDEGIALRYTRPFTATDPLFVSIQAAAGGALNRILGRLTEAEQALVAEAAGDPSFEFSEYESNHVLQSAVQIAQMATDAERFCVDNDVPDEERGNYFRHWRRYVGRRWSLMVNIACSGQTVPDMKSACP